MRIALTVVHLALLATGIFSLLLTAPENTPTAAKVLFAAVVYGPLVLFLPASLTADRRLLTWFSFMLLFYFCWFVTEAVDPPPMRYWAIACVTQSIVLFSLIVIALKKGAQKPASEAPGD